MNVSIATVAKDVGTTVTGIQLAITLYTLVMAAFMITGGKVGQILGRKRAFMIGCLIYGTGSAITALAGSLPVLLVGWSILEGLGAVLIMPSVVALVATNFEPSGRPRAYGLVASAGAIAVAVGPLVGGLLTTYASWRWVFAGEVVIVLVILMLSRPDGGLPRRARDTARPGGHAPLRGGARRDRLRHRPLRNLGVRAAEAGGSAVARPLPGDLARPRRRRDPRPLRAVGEPPAPAGRGHPGGSAHAAGAEAAGRVDLLLLPVPAAGRHLLRDPAVPLGGTGAVGRGNRGTPPPPVGDPAGRRRRGAPAVPACVATARSCGPASASCCSASSCC